MRKWLWSWRKRTVMPTLFKESSDEERKERLGELGPMVLEIINAHVHSFSLVASEEEALVLDAQGIAILTELMSLVRPRPRRPRVRCVQAQQLGVAVALQDVAR
ncbi:MULTISPECIES: hypothetical protein [unclassified Micromonospora]|uniref:hypothetical protein n=1 Tax=unclassified Micromonospora TaxID=2617518 RepID=UPI002FF1983F